jgi:hypothetical protein
MGRSPAKMFIGAPALKSATCACCSAFEHTDYAGYQWDTIER